MRYWSAGLQLNLVLKEIREQELLINNLKSAIRAKVGIHTATAIPFIYSFPGNSAASAPISTFMCLWAIYIFPGSVYIFPPVEQANPSWEYIIIRSQTHECGNWDWGPDIPFLGIFVSNFRHFVFAVHIIHKINNMYLETGKRMSPLIVWLHFFLFSELNILSSVC